MINKNDDRIIWDFDISIANKLGLKEAVVYERLRDLQNINIFKNKIIIIENEQYMEWERGFSGALSATFTNIGLSYEEVENAIKKLVVYSYIDAFWSDSLVLIKVNQTKEKLENIKACEELKNK